MDGDRHPVGIRPPAARRPPNGRRATGRDRELLELEVRHQTSVRHDGKRRVDRATRGLAPFCPTHKVIASIRRCLKCNLRPE